MNDKKKLEIINKKLDLTIQAVSAMPLFLASLHDKNPKKLWSKGLREWELIEEKYKEILEHEYNDHSSGVENKVS